LPPPFLTSASDAIPFRTSAVAESTGIHGHKGEQPFRAPLPDCACENKLPGNEDNCTLKADQTPIGLASVMSNRLVFLGSSAGAFGSFWRAAERLGNYAEWGLRRIGYEERPS